MGSLGWMSARAQRHATSLAPDSPFTDTLSESEVPNVQPVGIAGRHWEELDCLTPPDRRREGGGGNKERDERERERERMWEKRYREANVQRETNTVKYINSWGKEEGRWRGKQLHLPRTRSNINITHCRDSASSLILVLLSPEKKKKPSLDPAGTVPTALIYLCPGIQQRRTQTEACTYTGFMWKKETAHDYIQGFYSLLCNQRKDQATKAGNQYQY